MFKIDVKSSIETIEVGGKNFDIDLSDEKVKEYLVIRENFRKDYEKLNRKLETMDENSEVKEFDEIMDEVHGLMEKIYNSVLGKGSYDHVYGLCKSTFQTGEVILKVFEYISSKTNEMKNTQYEKYTGNALGSTAETHKVFSKDKRKGNKK